MLKVNRSSYYKAVNRQESNRDISDKYIRKCIVELYIKSDKRLGYLKMNQCLKSEYRINISDGKAYRMMKSMNLPKMSTIKPTYKKSTSDDDDAFKNFVTEIIVLSRDEIAFCLKCGITLTERLVQR